MNYNKMQTEPAEGPVKSSESDMFNILNNMRLESDKCDELICKLSNIADFIKPAPPITLCDTIDSNEKYGLIGMLFEVVNKMRYNNQILHEKISHIEDTIRL